jgi:putative membrane protein
MLRLGLGGVLMGLANLVPGVSGGTMVLVMGLYEDFIAAFSDLTRLRFTFRAVVVVAMLFGLSAVTIFLLAGGVQFLMESFMPGMLALFIGMTLGGAPMLFREMRPVRRVGVVSAALGIVLMGLVAFVLKPDTANPGFLLFFLGGIVGSATMILPGISGSYMLLVMGLYLPIIGAISAFKYALGARDIESLIEVGGGILLPVGMGLLLGLALMSNLLRLLLKNYHRPTIGFLMGLLLGSVLGLYPFKEPHFPKIARHATDGVVKVVGFGWSPNEDSVVWRNLRMAERQGVRVEAILHSTERPVGPADIESAAREGAVVIVYDDKVSKETRRAAAQSEPKVELIIVPNTELSSGKLFMVLALAPLGFAITFLLGRIEQKKQRG